MLGVVVVVIIIVEWLPTLPYDHSVKQFSNIKKRGVSVFVHHEEEDY